MANPARPLIHIGWARAASTAFRLNFLSRHPAIALQSRNRTPEGERIATALRAIKSSSDVAFDREYPTICSRLRNCDDDKSARVFCVSDEELSIGLPRRAVLPTRIAGRCKRVFPNCRILALVRNQLDAIRSFHRLASIMDPNDFTPLSDWVDRFVAMPQAGADFSYLYDYMSTLNAYREHWPKEEICVLPVEQLSSDPRAGYRQISRWLGISQEACELLPNAHANVSPPISFFLARQGKSANRRLKPGHASRRQTHGDRPANVSTRSAHELGKSQESALWSRYGPGNRELARIFALDLERWGYLV